MLFRKRGEFPWAYENTELDYKEDRTQWVKGNDPIEMMYSIELSKEDDPALISFIEKMAEFSATGTTVSLEMSYSMEEQESKTITVKFDGKSVDVKAAKEIDKKIKDSSLLFLYNSTLRKLCTVYSNREKTPLG